ncbi:MAG: hypothetical protein JNL01_12600 [Bdellovibrionales bacterium]|nr:hypothetical protein [Bdellovibrionales bacterium]
MQKRFILGATLASLAFSLFSASSLAQIYDKQGKEMSDQDLKARLLDAKTIKGSTSKKFRNGKTKLHSEETTTINRDENGNLLGMPSEGTTTRFRRNGSKKWTKTFKNGVETGHEKHPRKAK